MRHRVALMTMALGIMAAGSARAHDATQVIYDLSALRTPQVTAPRPSVIVTLPQTNLPNSTPSNLSTEGDALEQWQRPHGSFHGTGVGSPRGGNEPPKDASPTPEPGTLLLLGSALASGARFARKRSKA
jgi:hypothetical protein